MASGALALQRLLSFTFWQRESMTRTILTVATRNAHKMREIRNILGPELTVRDLSGMKDIPEVPETGNTFEQNAILKAVEMSRHVSGLVLADDSGLEVEALNGAPGVFSARYAGGQANDHDNVQKLLSELGNVDPDGQRRRAAFRCVLAVAQNGELLRTFTGRVKGCIVSAPRGDQGFGYDPVFVPNGYDKTFGELPASTKSQLSHRARALQEARPFLEAALKS